MFYSQEAERIREKIPDIKLVYCLLTGMTYREIAVKFYSYNINKVVYRIRQLYKTFNITNRRKLAYFVTVNEVVDWNLVREYKNA